MDDKVNLAIVGCGGMSHAHGGWINEIPEARVVALCDINPANMDRLWREKFKADPSIRKYDSMDKLLKNPPMDLRAVIIVTPHTLHYPQAMAALDAGFNVLVEKPMVTASAHAKKLAAKIKKTGLMLQVSFQASHSAEFRYIREVLQRDGLGELQTVTAWSHQGWRPRGPKETWRWRHDPKMSGGGQMYDTGAHLFNAIGWCLNRPVEEVFCWIDKKGMPVDINAVMTIRWQGGVLGTVTISGNNPGWEEGILIAGDKGRIHTSIHGAKLEHYEGANRIKYPKVDYTPYSPDQSFVHCLLGREKPLCPVRYGILHSWLMDALYKSAKINAPVKLTPPPLPPDEAPSATLSVNRLKAMVAAENMANPC